MQWYTPVIGETASNMGAADVKAAKKAAKASAAVNEHADFVRENNMVVECMGRYSYYIPFTSSHANHNMNKYTVLANPLFCLMSFV